MKKTIIALLFLVFIVSAASAETLVLPSVTISPGANNAYWKTSIVACNADGDVQTVQAYAINGQGDTPSATLNPGQCVVVEDLASLFSLGEGTFIAKVETTHPRVIVSARTYSVPLDKYTEEKIGQVGTFLTPITEINGEGFAVFTRVQGTRKALFLYGYVRGECITQAEENTVYVFYGTPEVITRHTLPDTTLGCKVSATGFPSGGPPPENYSWLTEADNLTNCPTLIPVK